MSGTSARRHRPTASTPLAAPKLPAATWFWVVVFSPAILLLHSTGASFGEPVADDFDFLHYSLVQHRFALFDGGGSEAFWRPIPHQLYYRILGHAMLTTPLLVTVLHSVLFALVCGLLYQSLPRQWPRIDAVAISTFLVFAESARSLLIWPSHFVELGLLVATATMILLGSRRHLAFIGAVVVALLTKEMAIVAVPLCLWVPGKTIDGPRSTRLWLLTLAAIGLWGIGYFIARNIAGLHPPSSITVSPVQLLRDFPARFIWSVRSSFEALMSLSPASGPLWTWVMGGLASVLTAAGVLYARNPRARAALRERRTWLLWGLVWFLMASCAVMVTYPAWSPYRSLFGGIGLGIALVVFLSCAHRGLVGALLLIRVLAYCAAPGASVVVSPIPPQAGSFLDFQRLTRIQQFAGTIRRTLIEAYPQLPAGATIGEHYFPQGTRYALGGDRALQVWYGDASLHWVTFDDFVGHPELSVTTLVEYEPASPQQVALVTPQAMREHLRARECVRRSDWAAGLTAAQASDALQLDSRALVLRASNAYHEAYCMAALGRLPEAEARARFAITLGQVNSQARFVLSLILASRGDIGLAQAELDTLLAESPGDQEAQELRRKLRQ